MADIFPIVATVVYDGLDHTKVLNKGDKVPCYFCKEPITINEQSVFVHEDGTKAINCRKCGSHVEAFYYYDKQINKKPNIPKKKRRKRRKFITPSCEGSVIFHEETEKTDLGLDRLEGSCVELRSDSEAPDPVGTEERSVV